MSMITKSEVLKILTEYDFSVRETTGLGVKFEKMAFSFNEKKEKGIVIAEYENLEELQSLKKDVFDVRQQLKKIGYNIWNIYYFIVIRGNVDRQIYSLERDSKDLRKYVILTESDIFRVPFIALSEKEKSIDFLDLNKESINTNDKEVDELVTQILTNNGEYHKISNQVMEEIVRKSILGDLANEA